MNISVIFVAYFRYSLNICWRFTTSELVKILCHMCYIYFLYETHIRRIFTKYSMGFGWINLAWSFHSLNIHREFFVNIFDCYIYWICHVAYVIHNLYIFRNEYSKNIPWWIIDDIFGEYCTWIFMEYSTCHICNIFHVYVTHILHIHIRRLFRDE